MPTQSFRQLLTILSQHQVDFIVVGGVAAVLQGAPVTTFDLDALIRVSSDNADAIMKALTELDATLREHQKPLRPTKKDLMAGGHLLLMTRSGPLDLLGFVGNQERYEDLLSATTVTTLDGRSLRVLNLEALIRLKRQLGRPKDQASLSLLEAVFEQTSKRST